MLMTHFFLDYYDYVGFINRHLGRFLLHIGKLKINHLCETAKWPFRYLALN